MNDDFSLNFELGNPFDFQKDASNIPKEFKDALVGEKGQFLYGVASTEDLDLHDEKVFISDEVAQKLEKPPYNKVYLNHKTNEIPAGVVKYSRMTDIDGKRKQIILIKFNEEHPEFKNIIGSVKNRSLDTLSVSGKAPRTIIHDPITNEPVNARKTERLHEVSIVGTPANPNAFILNTFEKNAFEKFLKNATGSFEIKNNENTEGKTMEEGNYVTEEKFEALSKDVKELTTSSIENNEKITKLVDGWEKFRKEEEEGDDKETSDEEEEEPEKKEEPEKEKTAEITAPDVAKEIALMQEMMQTLQKQVSERKGTVNNSDPRISKNIKLQEISPENYGPYSGQNVYADTAVGTPLRDQFAKNAEGGN